MHIAILQVKMTSTLSTHELRRGGLACMCTLDMAAANAGGCAEYLPYDSPQLLLWGPVCQ